MFVSRKGSQSVTPLSGFLGVLFIFLEVLIAIDASADSSNSVVGADRL